jgi:hypothetical protein
MNIVRSRHLWLCGMAALLAAILMSSFMSPAVPATSWPTTIATVSSAGGLTLWTPEGGRTQVPLPKAVNALDLTPDGRVIAVATGSRVEGPLGGVLGEILVLQTDDLLKTAKLSETGPITHVAISSDAGHVAYVKNFSELWVFDVELGVTRLLTSTHLLAPGVLGSVFFDPVFEKNSADPSVIVGVVEKTFLGEDDKLDNLWRVPLTGTATKVTSLVEGPGEEDWHVLRRPATLSDGATVYTTGSSTSNIPPDTWTATAVGSDGVTRSLGPVPPMTLILGMEESKMVALVWDGSNGLFDLYAKTLPSGGTWSEWCENGCFELIIRSN